MGLDDDPFDWRRTKDGRVLVSRGGIQVAVVGVRQAQRLIPVLEEGGDLAQHALARVTGNYRRGNEKRPKRP